MRTVVIEAECIAPTLRRRSKPAFMAIELGQMLKSVSHLQAVAILLLRMLRTLLRVFSVRL